jgi:hypothetical protein
MKKLLFINICFILFCLSCTIFSKKSKSIFKCLESINYCKIIDSLQNDTAYESRVKYQILDKQTVYVNDHWNSGHWPCDNKYAREHDSLCIKRNKTIDSLTALKFRVILRYKHLKVEGHDNGDLSNFSLDSLQTGIHIYRLMHEKARIFIADSLHIDKNAMFRDKALALYFSERFRQFYFSHSYYDCIQKSVKNRNDLK